jgi:response regulator of citrate/malate metabolism
MRASDPLTHACILVVDDQEPNVKLLKKMLRRAGYLNVVATTDPRQVAMLYAEHDPDLIVLDLGVVGEDLLRRPVAGQTFQTFCRRFVCHERVGRRPSRLDSAVRCGFFDHRKRHKM